jgi:hypothetical protein
VGGKNDTKEATKSPSAPAVSDAAAAVAAAAARINAQIMVIPDS